MSKTFFSIIFFLFLNFSFSQKNNLYVYETYQDYVSNNPIDCGLATGFGEIFGFKYIMVKNDNKDKKIKINNKWGFKIGNFLFRFNEKENIPVSYLKNELGLYFYIDAEFTLSQAIWGFDYSNSSDNKNDGYFYSNDLNSKIFEISKIVKIENPSTELKDFIECIKDAKERYGDQAKFNSYTKCILPKKEKP